MSNEQALNSENLLLQSQNFGTTWNTNPTVASRAASSGTGPDGSDSWLQTAATSGSAFPNFNQSFSFKASTQYSYSVFVKAGTATHAWFAARGNVSNSVTGTLNFSSPNSLATTSNGWTVDSSSVTAFGSWYRISITFTTNSTVSSPFVYVGLSDGTVPATYYPTGTPNGETLYIWGAQLEERGSATAYNSTTTQIHREYSPLLKTASADSPRFEFATDGQSVGTAKGLLIEAQATNYNTKSEDIAGWSAPGGMSVSASAMVAPNGTLTADVLTVSDDTVASGHFAYRSSSAGTSGETVAVSFFAKSAGVNHIYFYDNGVGAASVSIFDLNNGTIGGTNASNCKMIDCGNGWWRCVSVYTLTGTGEQLRFYTSDNGSTTTYIANGYDSFALWGVQVEKASSESSYISTSGSTVTRASDSCSVVDATLFSSGEHTVIWEGDTDKCGDDPNVDKRFFSLSDTTTSNRLTVDYNDGTQVRLRNWADGGNDVAITYNADLTSGTHKVAATLKTNEAQLVVDGTRRQVDTSCVVGTGIQRLGVNTAFADAYQQYTMNGHCKRITYYNVALSQTEVEALTSNP